MIYQPRENSKPLGVVWVDCSHSLISTGLVRALEGKGRVHQESRPPRDVPSCVIVCANGVDSVSERVRQYKEQGPDSPPIVVFSPQLNLSLAHEALKAGASGFVHAEMTPDQLVRAVTVASEGELVAPRELLAYVLREDRSGELAALSARQREVLGYVVEGLSNAEIGRRLYLSESTIKQHLRSAYKLLGVSNRTEAANIFRRSD
jgi:DNA-binding NarL/FixJ family response regulator